LGDLGVNGMPISIGKLSLYVVGAGIRPKSTIPICLDLGTNNEKFLGDPFYLGLRQKRVSDDEMTEFMDEFMAAMSDVFPKLVIQFEVRSFQLSSWIRNNQLLHPRTSPLTTHSFTSRDIDIVIPR
jgi:malic enzyme